MMLPSYILMVLGLFAVGYVHSSRLPPSDAPFYANNMFYLDGVWTADNGAGLQIKGNVPGDLITDLHTNNIIPEPLFNENWIDYKKNWVDYVWTYTKIFDYNINDDVSVSLVFEGVKMGAYLTLNGVKLGNFSSQFLLYNFSVKNILKPKNNVLSVRFPSGGGPEVLVDGQFMTCSAGWDWAPYSYYPEILSKGIWKSVYLIGVKTVAITYIVPQIKFTGSYPTSPINHGNFLVSVKIYYEVAPGVKTLGTFSLSSDWHVSNSTSIDISESGFVTINLKADNVSLWWPAGYGKQNLYNFVITYKDSNGQVITITRRIGFRVFALVTADDSDPQKLLGKDGNGNLLMRFKINGMNIVSKGANFIPMEEFEGRLDVNAFRALIQSAADANMNTIRIWGGGTYLSDKFYDAADEIGMMIFHDMMYSAQWQPTETETQRLAIVHNVRRLAAHTSIIVWSGCNECYWYNNISSWLFPIIVGEDISRPIWGRSPSDGWNSGVDRLYSLPNGKPLNFRIFNFTNMITGNMIDTHGDPYYYGGSGWPNFQALNKSDLGCPSSWIMRHFSGNFTATGTSVKGKFISEFGVVSMSSFESMSGTLDPKYWGLHTPAFYQRNYPVDNFIKQYFNDQNLNLTGIIPFQRQLYQSLIAQAIHLKEEIIDNRSRNVFGTLVWQLNEIWPTGGWGMVEYGTASVNGQVLGGRWKPAMYMVKKSAYTDFICSCTNQTGAAVCFCKNDGVNRIDGTVTIEAIHFQNGSRTLISKESIDIAGNQHKNYWFCMKNSGNQCAGYASVLTGCGCDVEGVDCMILVTVTDKNNNIIYKNEIAQNIPGNMLLQPAKLDFTVAVNDQGGADIKITSNALAVYVVLTTRAHGRFSDNAMMIFPGQTVLSFIPFGVLDMSTLTSSLRIEHAQQYISRGAKQICPLNLPFGIPYTQVRY